ncbi:FmdE family protein [Maridesulfovibrio zosterae]|uniref:FmdE family protein n=1 Tax=Maridesulfovibrio zosterae TaxID=82171 RepID=UPI0003FAB81D|nr:FmdE family protein [Maridesulfovibrio zosterae]
MGTSFSTEQIQNVINFHGHQCPGLAIGIRVSDLCLNELGHNNDSPLVAICETDMCGVDAIQFFTGCSVGKGNLLFKDYGKMAFTFYRRNDEKGFRALLNPQFMKKQRDEMSRLMKLVAKNEATAEEKTKCNDIRSECEKAYLNADLDELFFITEPQLPMPRPAQILQSLVCDNCNELHMESRSRKFMGQTLCTPCFEKVEQKI